MINFTNMKVAKQISKWFDHENPQSAYEQLMGFTPYKECKLFNWSKIDSAVLVYRGGNALREISRAILRDETIILFPYHWVAIVQPDGKYIVTKYV